MNHCLICQEVVTSSFGWSAFLGLQKHAPVCGDCEHAFQTITGELCRICGREWRMVADENRYGDLCSDCFRWEGDPATAGLLKKNRSVYHYNENMKDILSRYKFRGDAALSQVFQEAFTKKFKEACPKEKPIVVPIPLSPERIYERGFNQSLLLAELLPGKPEELLSKTSSEKQSKKARWERLDRENTFFVPDSELVKGKNILLIDDIYTTGTTVRMAAKVLKNAGAYDISSYTLVRS
ncbi:ComF family protein [Sutcliffiella horikoshii]|uniref:ComF family protein n=1 Tax=Sutcliffiella horikoshii TaxID=79883 RepID=A0A5D4T3K6_9BACI|nr:ComF family protein [Sutcliffiella horikoshii]TYS69879.1 ComF family protein [Sutcliffiella horikoshii]